MSVQKWVLSLYFFNEASTIVWPRIFKLPFKTVRDIKIQFFQYQIIPVL